MTEDGFERLVAAWLEVDGPQHVPIGLAEAAFASAQGIGQRRGLRAIISGPGTWPARRGPTGRLWAPQVTRAALVGLVVIAIIGASLFVASRLQKTVLPRFLGEVSPTGSMGQPRVQPKLTLLADGTVLVSGGAGLGEVVSAELYDPSTGSFVSVGSMGLGSARGRVDAQVRLADGRVLVVGSTGGDAAGVWPYVPFALVYEPSTRSFIPTSEPLSLTVGLGHRNAVVLADGRVRFDGGPEIGGTVWFDPVSGSFTEPDIAAAREDAFPVPASVSAPVAVRLHDDRRLVTGTGADFHTYAFIYDSANRSTTDLGQPPLVAGDQPEATVLSDGRVLILGDWSALFDPVTAQFVALDGDADRFVGMTIDGRAVLASDTDGDQAPGRIWIFDPRTPTMTPLDATLPVDCCTAWTSLSDGRLLGVGGSKGEEPSGTALIIR
ncbi:MAG: hypothetical protein ACJ77V_11000 [Chloroflexota bacterium]